MLLILLIVIVLVVLPQVGQTMRSTWDVNGAKHDLPLLNEHWTMDGSRS